MDVGGVPLGELRMRYLEGDRLPPPSVIEALLADGRRGARALAEQLQRVRRRALRERRRLLKLSELEERHYRAGIVRLAGVDEVGMGPLAGPVVAAAVVLPRRVRLRGLDDSKRVQRAARERLDREIREVAYGIGIGWATPEEIDRINIYQAGLNAMRRAVDALPQAPEIVLADARTIPDLPMPQECIVGGDGRVASVAAASIVAKVYRDSWMRDLDRRHPEYGFSRNVGYGTREHLRALTARGPCPAHRMSYAPVRASGPFVRGA